MSCYLGQLFFLKLLKFYSTCPYVGNINMIFQDCDVSGCFLWRRVSFHQGLLIYFVELNLRYLFVEDQTYHLQRLQHTLNS